jgi:hypothetical protein
MIRPVFVILCDYGIFDSWRKRLSVIGIFDYFSAAIFPTRLRFDVVSKWLAEGDEQEGDFMVRVTSAPEHDGERYVVGSTKHDRLYFDWFTRTASNAAQFDLQIGAAGDYQIEFYFDNELVHTKTLAVIPEG